jgi:hypothetical protein
MPPGWRALRKRLGSRLVLAGDPGYAVYRLGYNKLNGGQRPAAIGRCALPADVQACLHVARGAASRSPPAVVVTATSATASPTAVW